MIGIDQIQGLTPQNKMVLKDLLDKLEAAVDDISLLSNPHVSRGSWIDEIDPPTGIRIIDNVGTFHVGWEPAFTRYLSYYEVQIATNGSFTAGLETFPTRELEYTYYGLGNQARFVRVRTVTPSGTSAWSAVLDTATGQAQTLDLAPNVITGFNELRRFVFLDSETIVDDGTMEDPFTGDPSPWPNEDYQEYDYYGTPRTVGGFRTWCSLTVRAENGVVRPRWSISTLIKTGEWNGLLLDFAQIRVAVMRDGAPVGETYSAMLYMGQFSDTFYPFYATGYVANDEPGVGEFTYDLLVGIHLGGTVSPGYGDFVLTVEPEEVSLNTMELRR